MSISNGHHQEPTVSTSEPMSTGYVPVPSLSFQVGSYLAISDAEAWGNVPDAEVDLLACVSYECARLCLRLDKEDFLQGFRQSYSDWLNGLV